MTKDGLYFKPKLQLSLPPQYEPNNQTSISPKCSYSVWFVREDERVVEGKLLSAYNALSIPQFLMGKEHGGVGVTSLLAQPASP